jgi:single-strand DNA-binding protein
VNRRNDREKSDFFKVSAWGELGNNCARYLGKGKRVRVTGSVSLSTYTAQDGTTRASLEVLAQDVEFLSPASQGQQNAPQAPKTDAQSGFVQVDGEELPF